MIIFFQELSSALAVAPGEPAADAIDTYLHMNPDSTLAQILNKHHQTKQFDVAAVDILQSYLEAKTYNCKPAQIFLKEVTSKLVLESVVTTCSKPEWINGWIVYLLEDGEPEILEAIDAGIEDSADKLQDLKTTSQKRQQALAALEAGESSEYRKQHKRVVSRAQEAMDEAMKEAQRLSQMIADEDAKRLKESHNTSSSTLNDDQSESTTQGIVTPTSSQSETHPDNEVTDLGISGLSSLSGQSHTQMAPRSSPKLSEESDQPRQAAQQPFTTFDQILPNNPPTALMASPPQLERPPPLTLHNSKISIFDDAMPGEKTVMKNKPTVEYLIQIEPASHHHSGWMTAKKFNEFEALHEVIRRIAAITGQTGFNEAHPALPAWKGLTKASFRGELERYLNDAVSFKQLAESEGMRRFLDKEMGSGKSPGNKGFPGLGWPGQTFENMGKGMVDALTKAPKEVAGGGKALFGGVTGVLGSVTTPFGGKKHRDSVSKSPARSSTAPTESTSTIQNRHTRAESTVSELPKHIRTESTIPFTKRASSDSLRLPNSPIIDQQPGREAPMERRPSLNPDGDGKRSGRSSIYGASRSNSRAPSARASMDDLSPLMGGDQILNLPPVPTDIPDDYNTPSTRTSQDPDYPHGSVASLPPANSTPPLSSAPKSPPKPTAPKSYAPLSEQETTVLIELFFAVIQELYTLSSAWNIRRTLLNAAKTFLLRPGNPQLTSIQALLQSTVLDDNTSDEGIAFHLKKIRENTLPTAEELAKWPVPSSDEDKEKLRVKARKLLVERGMPQALTSVMGQAASGEALGRVFDCLQDERVARGVIFGLVLQGLRAVTQ